MEATIRSVRKYWTLNNSQCSDLKSLTIFDANGNTILQSGDISVPENDAAVLSTLLGGEKRKDMFTIKLLNTNYLCMINSRGYLIGRGGFNELRENNNGERGKNKDIGKYRNLKIEMSAIQSSSTDKLNDFTGCTDGHNNSVRMDLMAAGTVSELIVVVNGPSSDRESISELLADIIHIFKDTH